MNADIHLEHRASSSQGKHEGEPSLGLCDRLNRTRDNSQRQLPTDHDYAVSTREYQTDQSSLKTAPTAARSVFGKGQKKRQRQEQPHSCAELTRSLHIRPMHSSTRRLRAYYLREARISGRMTRIHRMLSRMFLPCIAFSDLGRNISMPNSTACV